MFDQIPDLSPGFSGPPELHVHQQCGVYFVLKNIFMTVYILSSNSSFRTLFQYPFSPRSLEVYIIYRHPTRNYKYYHTYRTMHLTAWQGPQNPLRHPQIREDSIPKPGEGFKLNALVYIQQEIDASVSFGRPGRRHVNTCRIVEMSYAHKFRCFKYKLQRLEGEEITRCLWGEGELSLLSREEVGDVE